MQLEARASSCCKSQPQKIATVYHMQCPTKRASWCQGLQVATKTMKSASLYHTGPHKTGNSKGSEINSNYATPLEIGIVVQVCATQT